MIRLFLILTILAQLATSCVADKSINIVPTPKSIEATSGSFLLKNNASISVSSNTELAPLAELLKLQFNNVYNINVAVTEKTGDVNLVIDNGIEGEKYTLDVTSNGITVKAGNYKALAQASISVIQMAIDNNGSLEYPLCKIADEPSNEYRTFMLDVARQWHDIETVKNMVDLCQWYKIRYMQLHLSDDQSFTFPSTAFPKLATEGRHYTKEQLINLVSYAEQRGVTLVPEFDAPAHTGSMRKAMPEYFGRNGLSIVNIADEKVLKACETIISEMMDIFHTSPYFHIGADEAWLGTFEKEEMTKRVVKEKGFHSAHDLYLDYIVRMHEFVKSKGKQTLVWESFSGNGSASVKIPTDIIVIGWETLYQLPTDIVKNGYTIINASWKPTYVTPGRRWSPEYIYNWNIYKWENFWEVTPAYKNPIIIDKKSPIMGGQMCSWEMSEYMQLPSIRKRLAALSERFWNTENDDNYADFYARMSVLDKKFSKLIFPAEVIEEGLTDPNYEGLYLNWEKFFGQEVQFTVKPQNGLVARYTTDGKAPTVNSPVLDKTLSITSTTEVRVSLFNDKNEIEGYLINRYEHFPVKLSFSGKVVEQKNYRVSRPSEEFFDEMTVEMSSLMTDATVKYTLDGTNPTKESKTYLIPITVTKTTSVKAACFNSKGEQKGSMWSYELRKIDFEENITTGQKVTASDAHDGYEPEKAVDGYVSKEEFWDASPAPQWLSVELEKETEIKKIHLTTYWDGSRYYHYTIDVSVNGTDWTTVVDASESTVVATPKGYVHTFDPVIAKFIKVTMTKNSANPGLHIVELRAY